MPLKLWRYSAAVQTPHHRLEMPKGIDEPDQGCNTRPRDIERAVSASESASASFMPQCIDRVHMRGMAGGEIAEHDPYKGGESE